MTRQLPIGRDYLLLAVLYFIGAKIGSLTVMPEGIAIIWPPNGVLLAFLIRFEGRGALRFLAIGLAAELAADIPSFGVGEAVLFGVANAAEAMLAYRLLARWGFDRRFARFSDLLKFIAAGPLTGAFAAACVGGLTYTLFRGERTPYLEFLRVWWFGDALGLMIVTPLFLGLWAGESNRLPSAGFRWVDVPVAIAALALVVLLTMSRDGAISGVHMGPIVLLPFVIFAAGRYGFRTAAVVMAALAGLVLLLTTRGQNPFGHATPQEAVTHAQEFVFVAAVMTLGLAALISYLRTAEAEVHALNISLEERVRDRTRELETTLAEVKHLRGLLPMCAWCRKLRDDKDYWHTVEDYISRHTDARVSHGICPDCSERVSASW